VLRLQWGLIRVRRSGERDELSSAGQAGCGVGGRDTGRGDGGCVGVGVGVGCLNSAGAGCEAASPFGSAEDLSPRSGKKGSKVTIHGSGFRFATTVSFGAHKAHVLTDSATKVTVQKR
jgi:hypothetical protein